MGSLARLPRFDLISFVSDYWILMQLYVLVKLTTLSVNPALLHFYIPESIIFCG